jgi:polyisoprenoid-binding protein YceI
MFMKWSSLLLGVSFASLSFAANMKAPVETAESVMKWKGTKVTGFHEGNIKLKSGELEFAKNNLTGGVFQIDMTSMTVTDITDAKTNKKLVEHLMNDDFFSVPKHPTAQFKISKVEPIRGAKAGQPTHTISGDLTIKGITKATSFPATVTMKDGKFMADAEIKVDRTMFDIRYGSGKFFENLGDKMISDEFTMNVKLAAKTK